MDSYQVRDAVQSVCDGEDTVSVCLTCVCVRACVQEVDLERMREQWLVTLTQRQEYLDQQLQKIVCKAGTAGNTRAERGLAGHFIRYTLLVPG